jgi:CubicO group peptidase (beta-lactamase class C family)
LAADAPIAGECHARFARLRRVFEKSFEEGEVGAAVAVVIDGDPVVDLWGGFADAARTRHWERDTIVHVASTTKGMTALCLNRLVDEGRLEVDQPAAKHWPEFAQAGKERIPVRWFLSHRAGLPAVRRDLPENAIYDWELMIETLEEEAPWWEPGTRHGYHALTFGFLVGEVLRRIDGRSLGAYFNEEIAQPLGLDFHIGLDESHDVRCAEMLPVPRGARNAIYSSTREPGSMIERVFSNPPRPTETLNTFAWRGAEIPAANGHGTARALARAYGALARGGEVDGIPVLSKGQIERATREESYGPDAVLLGVTMRFGLGFMLRHPQFPLGAGEGSFGHAGMGGSIAFADPESRIGFAYVMNQMQSGLAHDARGFRLIGALAECL